MKSLINLVFFILLIGPIGVQSKEGEIGNAKNRISIRIGYAVSYLFSDTLPLAINYERLLPNNFSIGGSLGQMAIPINDINGYHLAEVTLRRFFFGSHQRLVIGVHPFIKYSNRFDYEMVSALPVEVGYFWQWRNVFLSLEGGMGPGITKSIRKQKYFFSSDIVDATLNFGTAF